ncbi:MAG: hypothetical protein AB1490_12960 [Pseudomonadota bacterium]
MITCFEEPTVDELLSDPLVRQVMYADGVDTTALRSMFSVLASEIAARSTPIPARRLAPVSGFIRSLVIPQNAASGRASCFCGA